MPKALMKEWSVKIPIMGYIQKDVTAWDEKEAVEAVLDNLDLNDILAITPIEKDAEITMLGTVVTYIDE